MKSIPYIFAGLIMITLVMCKSDASSSSDRKNSTKTEHNSDGLRQKDLSHLTPEQRSKWTFLTLGYFQKDVELRGGKILNLDSLQGHWAKFYDDYTYELGDKGEVLTSGSWLYDHDKTLLELLNDDQTARHAEYKVMSKDDVVIFVGTSKYGNNSQQIKWVRVRD